MRSCCLFGRARVGRFAFGCTFVGRLLVGRGFVGDPFDGPDSMPPERGRVCTGLRAGIGLSGGCLGKGGS